MNEIDRAEFKELFLEVFEPFATSIQQEFIKLRERVDENHELILEVRAAVETNRRAIAENRAEIKAVRAEIKAVRAEVEAVRTEVEANRVAIETNRQMILENRAAIEQNARMITELRDDMRLEMEVIKGILRSILQRLDKLEAQGATQQRDVADLRQRVTRLEQVVFA